MRRKTEKEVRKEYRGMLIASMILIAFGLFLLIAPYVIEEKTPTPYEELEEIAGVGASLDRKRSASRSTNSFYYELILESGEEFRISEAYFRDYFHEHSRRELEKELERQLISGEELKIKYEENRIWRFHINNLVKEIRVGDVEVVTFGAAVDSDGEFWSSIVCAVCGILIAFVGCCLFVFYRYMVKDGVSQIQKRNRRIQKKYGDKAKIPPDERRRKSRD